MTPGSQRCYDPYKSTTIDFTNVTIDPQPMSITDSDGYTARQVRETVCVETSTGDLCLPSLRVYEVLDYNETLSHSMGDEGVDGYFSFWPRIDLKTGQARLDSQLTWLQRLVTQGKANDYVVGFNLSTPGGEYVTIGGYNSTPFTPNKDGKLPTYHNWVSQV